MTWKWCIRCAVMPDVEPRQAWQDLLDAAFQEALKKFAADVQRGEIDPVRQRSEFSRRRRDYSTHLRMQTAPAEARELAARLLQTHEIRLDDSARKEFEFDVTRLLIRLYDAFIERSQGSR